MNLQGKILTTAGVVVVTTIGTYFALGGVRKQKVIMEQAKNSIHEVMMSYTNFSPIWDEVVEEGMKLVREQVYEKYQEGKLTFKETEEWRNRVKVFNDKYRKKQ
jgi:hypothetical protein